MNQNNRNAKVLQSKSKTHEVTEGNHGIFKVTSGSSHSEYFVSQVNANDFHCTCKYHEFYKTGECSHTIAVRKFIAENNSRSISAWSNPFDAMKQHQKNQGYNDGVYFTSRKTG